MSFSVGFGVIFGYCLFYTVFRHLCFKENFGNRALSIRTVIVCLFYFVAMMSFLKPFIHMNTHFGLTMEKDTLWYKF